jgi:hypothetical protein
MADAESAEAEVRETLGRLKTLKGRLDAVDAEISQLVPRVEAMLDSLRLGVPLQVEMEARPNGEPTYLSFTKVGKQWRLCKEWSVDDDGLAWETQPLSDLPRDDRAWIFGEYLPGILDVAVGDVELRIRRREETIRSTKQMVDLVAKVLGEDELAGVTETGAPSKRKP